jgi:hypothetical protein
MNKFYFLFLSAILFGCSDNGLVLEERTMIVKPTALFFEHGEETKTISITHTCTCAFSWTCSITPPNGVLADTTGVGDSPSVVIRVADRSKMPSDTLYTKIIVNNNSPLVYGIDTVSVTVIR